MDENKKNTRIFYLTLAIVLAIISILIIAIIVARRNSTNEIPESSSSLESSQPSNPTISETDTLPEFSLPVNGTISIDYSDSLTVFSQTMGDYRTHLGVDVLSDLGTEVLAVADGTVSNVWDDPFMGTCVSIEHSGNAVSIYKNLSKDVADGITIGCSVKAGDIIGTVGETAMNEIAQEPHLHYELKVDGKHVNPKDHIKFPIKEDNQENNNTENSENQTQS